MGILVFFFFLVEALTVCFPTSWDLDVVLRDLMSTFYESIRDRDFRTLTKVLFLVALATVT